MFNRSKTIAGLDIGSSAVKAVELQRTSDGMKLLRFGYAPLPPEAIVQGSFMNAPAIASAIRDACGSAGIKAKEVATSAAGHAVIVKKITLPTQSADELDETIHWEAEQYIPFDINEVNVDYQILQDSSLDGQMDVMLVAAKKDLIDNYQSVIQEAGLSLAVMDVDAFALGNMYEFGYAGASDAAVALVDIGAAFININVMSGGIPTFTRDITSGGSLYTEEIQKTLNLSYEEAERIKLGGRAGEVSKDVVPQEVEESMREVSDTLIGEIQRSLDFYRATSSTQTISRVLLCGGSARVPGLTRLVQERIEIPVEVADPFARVEIGSAVDEERLQELAPSLAVAVGLGMRRSTET